MRELPHRLVFLDETSIRTGLTRLRGRCPRGERLYGPTPFGRWHSQTFVAGLTCGELIAPWIISGAMDQAAFDTYVETQLAPVLAPGTAVILDNLSTHRSPRAAASLKARSCWFLFLPPYSPDLNPTEMAFSKLKAHLRRLEARSFERVVDALGSICHLFTPTECENYFRAARYAPD
jgi:transposase